MNDSNIEISSKFLVKVLKTSDDIDFKQFVVGEKSESIFEFYSISRVLRPALNFCGFIVSAYIHDKLIGYTYVFRAEKPDTYYFSYIWVDKRYRSKGIGSLIHRKAIEEAKRRGARKLIATCAPSNYLSLSMLLNKFGWMIRDFKMNFYGKGEHRFILELDLLKEFVLSSNDCYLMNVNNSKRIKRLLKLGYVGTRINIENNTAKVLFQKINEKMSTFSENSARIHLDVKYSFDKRSKLLTVSVYPERIFYLKLPFKKLRQEYLEFLASILSFATAVNIHNFSGKIIIKSDFSVPKAFVDVVELYNKSRKSIEIQFENVEEIDHIPIGVDRTDKAIILFSGGKDSAYITLKLLEKYKNNDISALYVKGPTINAEYNVELKNVKSLVKYFDIKLNIIEVCHGDYGYNSMRVRNRGQWRGMLLLALGALYSKNVYWGINRDKDLHDSPERLLRSPTFWLYFGESKPAIDMVSKLLKINVNLLPPEFEVYKTMYTKYPEILKRTHSCFNPMRTCDINDWNRACLKCKTLYIYQKIINGEKLSKRDIDYIKSFEWHGDTEFLDLLRAMGYDI